MIKIENVTTAFGIKHLHLNISPGDFITVIGSNGAGKSTLLGLLAGSIMPCAGKIMVENEDITSHSLEQRAAWIGYVYQDSRLGTCGTLSVEENLAFAYQRGKKRGLRLALNRSSRDALRALLSDLGTGLENKLSYHAGQLSGGQRQVLSLVMATLLTPKLLLLDEHTAALDPKTAQTILQMTARIVAYYPLTVLMVTHDLTQALAYGNRTLLLQSGQVVLDVVGAERAGLRVSDLLVRF